MTDRAEEISEASQARVSSEGGKYGRKPDYRVKIVAGSGKELEFVFIESSRPVADVDKYIEDWLKLCRLCKDAHTSMSLFFKKEMLENSDDCKELLNKLYSLPIFALQIKGKVFHIATLDMAYGIFYRMLGLESFEIPLELRRVWNLSSNN